MLLNTITKRIIIYSVISTLVLGGALFAVNTLVFAHSCKVVYGGGKKCDRKLKITKEVSKDQDKKDEDKEYFDDIKLTSSEKNDLITFRLEVENLGDRDEKDLDIVDELPEQLEVVGGDKLHYSIDKIDNGDDTKQTFYITTRVKSGEFKSGVCVKNVARLKADMNDNDNKETVDTDDADVCFEKSKVTQLPKTGNEDAVIATMLGLGMVMTGFGLRKASEIA